MAHQGAREEVMSQHVTPRGRALQWVAEAGSKHSLPGMYRRNASQMIARGSLESIDDSLPGCEEGATMTTHDDGGGGATELGDIEDLLLFSSNAKQTTHEKPVDSGAAGVVAPPAFAPDFAVNASPGSSAGARYRTACGNQIANEGEKRVTLRTESGELRTMTFQVADAAKPLASAGRITARGHRVVLDDDILYILHKATNRKVPLYRTGDVFEMHVNVMPPKVAQKDKNAVLGELGCTWRAD